MGGSYKHNIIREKFNENRIIKAFKDKPLRKALPSIKSRKSWHLKIGYDRKQ